MKKFKLIVNKVKERTGLKKKVSAKFKDEGYVKAVNNLNLLFREFNTKEFRMRNLFYKELNKKDSRKVIFTSIYNLFTNPYVSDNLLAKRYANLSGVERQNMKNRSKKIYSIKFPRDALNLITAFIKTRPPKYQAKYLHAFANIFYELNIKKNNKLVKIQGTKFVSELVNTLSNQIKLNDAANNYKKISDLHSMFEYLSIISSDILKHFESSTYKNCVSFKDVKEGEYTEAIHYNIYVLK